MSKPNTINALNDLIVTLQDADKGFHAAAEEVRDSGLKTQLHKFGQDCSTIWGEMQTEVRSLGGEPEESGSFSGKCRRIWTEVKTAFTDKDESVVLQDCVKAQKSLHDQFEELLSTDGLPSNVKEFAGRHFSTVKEITGEVVKRNEYFQSVQNG